MRQAPPMVPILVLGMSSSYWPLLYWWGDLNSLLTGSFRYTFLVYQDFAIHTPAERAFNYVPPPHAASVLGGTEKLFVLKYIRGAISLQDTCGDEHDWWVDCIHSPKDAYLRAERFQDDDAQKRTWTRWQRHSPSFKALNGPRWRFSRQLEQSTNHLAWLCLLHVSIWFSPTILQGRQWCYIGCSDFSLRFLEKD